MKLKFIEEKAMKVVMLVTTLLVFLFVGSILYTIVKNGWGAMNHTIAVSVLRIRLILLFLSDDPPAMAAPSRLQHFRFHRYNRRQDSLPW